jgi:hypothetical protein
MNQDTYKTKVTFHKCGDDSILAFFPEIPYSGDPNLFQSYQHIGQHGACHVDFLNECTPATSEEYQDLKSELESLGYNLEVI